MDYHLENKILLSEVSEHKSLYSWSLQEFNNEDKKVGRDQIPWPWTLFFTASELSYHYSVNKGFHDGENAELAREKESITAIFHSGLCRDGKSLEDDARYSMFGTNREINQFNLRIEKVKEGSKKEVCYMWGCVSHTTELDFENITIPDTIEISLGLLPERFNKLVEAVKNQQVDTLMLLLKGVSGFYSEWSPSIRADSIKILTRSEEHAVKRQDNCKIEPPRLGQVSEFDMTVIQRHKLNLKQDLRAVNVDSLFEEVEDEDELNDVEEEKTQLNKQKNENSLILSQLSNNESALKKLSIPLWLIFIILCLHFFK